MGGSPVARGLLECLQLALGTEATPWLAMAALSGSLPLVLAWALLSRPLMRVEGTTAEGPCEQQLRQRQSSSEAEQVWVSTAALLSSVCATWLFLFYALHCLCVKKGQCAQEVEGECEMPWEGSQESCAEGEEDRSTACGSQALACTQPRCGSRKPASNQAQQAYARQLASMERELEGFLCEVRSRRCVLGEVLTDGKCSQDARWDPDKLRITVYEISDREGAGEIEERGRKRRLY